MKVAILQKLFSENDWKILWQFIEFINWSSIINIDSLDFNYLYWVMAINISIVLWLYIKSLWDNVIYIYILYRFYKLWSQCWTVVFLFKLTLLKLKSYTTFNPFFLIYNPHKAYMAEIVYRLQQCVYLW